MSSAQAIPIETNWRPAVNPWIIALTVTLATFMEVLDTSVANVALPHIAGSLSACTDESTWVLTSYLVSNAIVLPMSGWFSSLIGRKRFYMSCVALFTVSSFLCGLAPSLGAADFLPRPAGRGRRRTCSPANRPFWRIPFRPSSAAWRSLFTAWRLCWRRPSAPPSAAGSQTISIGAGFSSSTFPVGIISLFLTNMLITDPPYMKKRSRKNFSIDYIGLGLLALGLGTLQVVLDKGQRDDWFSSHLIVVMSAISAVALVAVIIWEWNHKQPIIDLHLFKDRSFGIGNMLMFMVGFALLSSTVLLPLFLQTLMGYTAQEAGLSLMAGGFVIIAAMPIVGFMLSRYDARKLLLFGLVVVSLSLFNMTRFNTLIDFRTAATARAFQALGLAFLFVPINTVAYAFLPKDKNNAASGLINLSRNMGGSLGISLVTTILARRSQYHQSVLSSHINGGNDVLQSRLAATSHMLVVHGSSPYEASQQAYGIIQNSIIRQATMMSYVDCFKVLGIAVACMIPFVFLMKRVRPGGPMAVH